jgi:hypothetical protein
MMERANLRLRNAVAVGNGVVAWVRISVRIENLPADFAA